LINARSITVAAGEGFVQTRGMARRDRWGNLRKCPLQEIIINRRNTPFTGLRMDSGPDWGGASEFILFGSCVGPGFRRQCSTVQIVQEVYFFISQKYPSQFSCREIQLNGLK
jgi:hypothetical protein